MLKRDWSMLSSEAASPVRHVSPRFCCAKGRHCRSWGLGDAVSAEVLATRSLLRKGQGCVAVAVVACARTVRRCCPCAHGRRREAGGARRRQLPCPGRSQGRSCQAEWDQSPASSARASPPRQPRAPSTRDGWWSQRKALPTTERLVWQCGEHTAPKIGVWIPVPPVPYHQHLLCFWLCHVATRGCAKKLGMHPRPRAHIKSPHLQLRRHGRPTRGACLLAALQRRLRDSRDD